MALVFISGLAVGAALGVFFGFYFYSRQTKWTRLEFESLAQKIFENKTDRLNETTEGLLKPLREYLSRFEKSVDEKYTIEAKERHVLKSEIEKLILLNDKMAVEARSLTEALRGDNKAQGDWGELVLKRVLEASGLREGHEYVEQSSHVNEDGDRLRPDVVVHLPDGKHVVIDSKVSLRAYDAYRASANEAPNEAVKAKWISEHIKSLERHIDELSQKNYAKLKGVHSPDFVLMFVPIEPAYILAMHSDPDLSTRAWQKGVAIVTSTTLLVSLKTIASIWKVEKQNKNALEIAHEGARLYDKFAGFIEDFEKIGHTFESGQKQFTAAMNKLRDGPGSVSRKIERLKELGASPNKSIPSTFLE